MCPAQSVVEGDITLCVCSMWGAPKLPSKKEQGAIFSSDSVRESYVVVCTNVHVSRWVDLAFKGR